MPKDSISGNTWIKVASATVVLIVGGLGAVAIERLGSISQDLGSLQNQIGQVEEIGHIVERLTRVEESLKAIDPQSEKAAFAQLSSAKTQRPPRGKRTVVEMELRDAISNMKFDPRRSSTDLTITHPGAYFLIAAPQTNVLNPNEKPIGCFDMWMSVNGKDVANSNVRHCFPADSPWSTDVIVSQGVGCFEKGDVVNLVIASDSQSSGAGIVAISPPDEPMIPSIIFSTFRVGSCTSQ